METEIEMNQADAIARAAITLRDRVEPFPFLGVLNLDGMCVVTEGLPTGWSESGNLLLFPDPNVRPNIVVHPGLPMVTNSIIIIGPGGILPEVIMVWGDGALVWLGGHTGLPSCYLHCGNRSTIAIGSGVSSAVGANLNARNGGAIGVGSNGLWSNGIYVATDDMHAILDKQTGERINPYGGRISIGNHVWLGMGAMVLGGQRLATIALLEHVRL